MLNLGIIKSTGELLSFDLTLNENNQFSATIQNLDAGLTNITLNGYDARGTRMYNGDWEGQVRQDGKPTQVELFMTDLKPDIDVATLSNIAPFFLSIEMEPSNIAKNETVVVKTRAKDLDDGSSALNYTFRPLSALFGDVTTCQNGREYCTMEYRSDLQDSNGVKEFEMDVSDGVANDTVKGGFNIRAYGGINLVINFNNRPGVSSVSVDNSFLYDAVGHDSLQVNMTLFDDNYVDWSWDVIGQGPGCSVMDLYGDIQGQYALQKDISVTFKPAHYIESECKLRLVLQDLDDLALTYQMEIPFYLGNKLYNTAPYISTGYSTASSAPAGSTITYVIFARDRGQDELRATWEVHDAGSVLEMSSVNSTSSRTPAGFSQYTFIMKLNATGTRGNVKCTVHDAYNVGTQMDFPVGQFLLWHEHDESTTTTTTIAPTTTPSPVTPLLFREEGSRAGNCAPTRLDTDFSTKADAAAACAAAQTDNPPCTAVYQTPTGDFETRTCGPIQMLRGWCRGYPQAATVAEERCDTGHSGDRTFFYRVMEPETTTTSTTTSTTTTTTSTSSPASPTPPPSLSISQMESCATQQGFTDARGTLSQLVEAGGCSASPSGFYASGCSIYETGVPLGAACSSMARTSSSCTLQGCDGQNPPECDQAMLSAQDPRVTTRAWSADSFTECAAACTATINSYWHGIYIKQCETGCVVRACEIEASAPPPVRRRLTSRPMMAPRRRLEAATSVVNPYVFGLSMAIADRTLRIQSNSVPQAPVAETGDVSVPTAQADDAGSSSSGSALPLTLGVGGGMVALLVGSVLYKQRLEQRSAPASVAEETDTVVERSEVVDVAEC
jgi:hypothetical protein